MLMINKRRLLTCFFIVGSFTSGVMGKSLNIDPIEKKIIAWVEKSSEEQIEYLAETVNINSGTLNIAGNRKLGKVYQSTLEPLGFEVSWVELPKAMNRAGHFFANRSGKQGKKVLLIGHLDTVFEKNSSFRLFKREGNEASGPGVVDMKGGNAIIIYALKALHQAGMLKDTQIQVAFPGDEEDTGKPIAVSRQSLIDAAKQSDYALAFEGGRSGFGTIGRRGFSAWRLEVTGRRAHSSGIFSESNGAGAGFEAARILHQFYTQLAAEDNLTFNAGVMIGGNQVDFSHEKLTGSVSGKLNIIPQTVKVVGDLRYLSLKQRDLAIEKMKAIVKQHLPKTSAQITFSNSYPPMEPTSGNQKLLKLFSQVSEDLGFGETLAYDPAKRGAGDISHVSAYVDSLDGLGAWGSGSHSTREKINLDSLEIATKRAAILIYRLTR
ncbi:M20/M25/M40 family metallo-hydrolase [Aliikangiella sp. IMCC44359]|uniref:M20/M25/M40 family metallo-hydrolase n=1 Tax=Aliikangiella sp. IMCC44359 TaxID=3459125 RepID=UPI00403B18E4